jgi:hypothetical protein
LGALSAFCVAKSKTSLRGDEFGFETFVGEVREDKAIRRCARVGGLNEESSTWRVFGGTFGGSELVGELEDEDVKWDGTADSTLNVELDDANEERRDR